MEYLGYIANIVLGVFVGLLVLESMMHISNFCDWILERAARRIPEPLRSRMSEEWMAHIKGVTGPFAKVQNAIGFYWGARKVEQLWRTEQLTQLQQKISDEAVRENNSKVEHAELEKVLRKARNEFVHFSDANDKEFKKLFVSYVMAESDEFRKNYRNYCNQIEDLRIDTSFLHDLARMPSNSEIMKYFKSGISVQNDAQESTTSEPGNDDESSLA